LPHSATCRCGPQTTQRGICLFLHTQEHYFGLRTFLRHQNLRFRSRQPERRGIRDHDIRLKFVNFAEALRGIAGFGNQVDVRLVLQQTTQTLPQQDVVVHEQTANLFAGKT
jgi:hypothetical protein